MLTVSCIYTEKCVKVTLKLQKNILQMGLTNCSGDLMI